MAGRPPPAKPWERAAGSTSGDASAPKPWDKPIGAETTVVNAAGDPTAPGAMGAAGLTTTPAARPWESSTASTSYGTGALTNTYGSGSMYARPAYGGSTYGSGYGSGAYGSSYGGYGGGMYGGSSYGSGGMYGNSYGGGMYGSSYGGGGMYGSSSYGYGGGGMYGRPGGMYGGGVMGPYGGPGSDPNNPMGPAQPPGAWQAMLAGLSGIMHFFGRISFLVDENAHAVHFFVSALLQLLDRAGSLYGELARFILRLLGIRRAKKLAEAGQQAQAGALVPAGPGAATAAAPKGFAPPALPVSGGQAPWDGLWQKN